MFPLVHTTVLECYLLHLDPDSTPAYIKNNWLIEIGRIHSRLREYRELRIRENAYNGDALLAEISDILETLPDLEHFETLEKNCHDDFFLEALISTLKINILNEQHSIYKGKNFRVNLLRKRLVQLKDNYNANSLEIFRLETELTNFIESELKSEVESMKIFDRLNNEKITPYFLGLARASQAPDDLECIKQDSGQAYPTPESREEDITKFYTRLYTNPTPGNDVNVHDIRDFLGDSVNCPEIQNAILNDAEKSRLERDLSVYELDKAVEQSNKKSAPGIDGLNNVFITKFWKYLRNPLIKYYNCCLEKGTLTENFRTARIRLIPKKGDKTKLANWRPISLLGCFYKILSRAFMNRLKFVMDKITAVGQKGYSNKKHCQEVVMSIIEGISKCKTTNIRGAVVSLDIRKAFDSISHSYLLSCLRFLNFGEKFINAIKLLCTNRKASIIMGHCKYGKSFDLERGNAQGDTISPFLFNIGYQILLLKINTDLQIDSFLDIPATPEGHPPTPATVSNGPRKAFAFADDCTVLTLLTADNLTRLKNILDNFHTLSGLECNVEKSHLMPIGNNLPVPADIRAIGFEVREEITVLGININGHDGNTLSTEDNILQKIRNGVNFWSRFNLSLPGRIDIAKTMLYSQLNYSGCFLPVSDRLVSESESLIATFVKGQLNVSRKKIFDDPEAGGLGIFEVSTFLSAQKCSWLKRSLSYDELWKIDLYVKSPGTTVRIKKKMINSDANPILHGLASAFESLLTAHTKYKQNFRKSYVFDNIAFTLGVRSHDTLNEATWGEGYNPAERNLYYRLTFDEVFDDHGIVRNQFLENFQVNPRGELAKKLKKLYDAAITKYGQNKPGSETFVNFINGVKKGSKKFRRVLRGNKLFTVPHNLVKFSDNTDTVIGHEIGRQMNSYWKNSFLSTSCRTFCYKLYNNILPYNHVLSHFVRGRSRNCTFCDAVREPEEHDETPLHLFYSCTVSENLLNNFFRVCLGTEVTRQDFFTVAIRENINEGKILTLVCLLIKKFVWDCKLSETLPDNEHLKNYIIFELKTICKIKKELKLALISSGLKAEFINNCT
jgi:hypothetical protein